jgi:hypothetical protein
MSGVNIAEHLAGTRLAHLFASRKKEVGGTPTLQARRENPS